MPSLNKCITVALLLKDFKMLSCVTVRVPVEWGAIRCLASEAGSRLARHQTLKSTRQVTGTPNSSEANIHIA